ncbi:MAG TPA: VTC domain-containing protein [Spirochaetota bacterium]|nr:VTC domain-containing protein [Spirochaetota bacterium]
MIHIERNLAVFRAIGLENLQTIRLMKRHDTKYLLHRNRLSSVLEYLYEHYEILEIDKKRSFRYDTLYYDTDDYYFYSQHHNQKLNRHKVRFRKYLDIDRCYFEVKFKSNKEITEKNRLLLGGCEVDCGMSDNLKEFARAYIPNEGGIIVEGICPRVRIGYSRITLANRLDRERLTFDLNLRYDNVNSAGCSLDNLVIAELKQGSFSRNSPFMQCFRDMRIFPAKFSKYCTGVALTERNVKTNRFKKRLLQLEKYL